jgi:hypothetical protein
MSRLFVGLCVAISLFALPAAAQVRRADVLQRPHILDGEWTVQPAASPGPPPFRMTLQTGPNQTLTGRYGNSNCHGVYHGASFTMLCVSIHASQSQHSQLIIGAARSRPPAAAARSARIVASPAVIDGWQENLVTGQRAAGAASRYRATRN